jgi:hypothetical protein
LDYQKMMKLRSVYILLPLASSGGNLNGLDLKEV